MTPPQLASGSAIAAQAEVRPWWRRTDLVSTIVCITSAIIIAGVCVSTAIGTSAANGDIHLASVVAPRHPDVLREEIMLASAEAASNRTAINPVALVQLKQLLQRAPLAAEPFAVEGAVAFRQGRIVRAEQLLVEARRRNARAAGVRFLLAELWLLQGKTEPALQEIILLNELTPEMQASVVTLLSSYAMSPGAAATLKTALEKQPLLRAALLSKLAEKAQNASLIVTLAPKSVRSDTLPDWQEKLLWSLVNAGEVPRAARMWEQVSGKRSDSLGDFNDEGHSPFTWTLTSSADASADPTATGLRVHYFGRQDTDVASHVLALAPGAYRLHFRLSNITAPSNTLEWHITCVPHGQTLAQLPLRNVRTQIVTLDFIVPDQCGGQNVALRGLAQTYPEEASLELTGLTLAKAQ